MSTATEQFKLDDGTLVGTGLLMPTQEESRLMSLMSDYPNNMRLDPKEIERRLRKNAVDVYKEKRKNRRRRTRNQANLGKCNGSSNATGAEICREEQGMPDIPLSDCYAYSLANGGQDNGSGLITTFATMQKNGIAPMQLQVGGLTKTLPNNFYNRKQVDSEIIKQADIEAKRFVGWEYYKASMNSFEDYCIDVASALANDQPVIFAWHVGSGSMRLVNSRVQVGRGKGNHSNVMHAAKWVGGKTLIMPDDWNSWGPCVDLMYGPLSSTGWGEDGGFGLFTMEDMFACAQWHCTYIMTSIRADANDPALQ